MEANAPVSDDAQAPSPTLEYPSTSGLPFPCSGGLLVMGGFHG